MRHLEVVLLLIGIVCLGLYCGLTIQAWYHQTELEEALDFQLSTAAATEPSTEAEAERLPALEEGDLVGRLEIPRLDVSVMVMEGTKSTTLRTGAGHIPGTAFPGSPGNTGIAAHRDTYFRSIRNIRKDDMIRLTTPRGRLEYRVISTAIVAPKDVEVLKPTKLETITLVTCYPFYYVGPSPKRFIVHATRAGKTAD